MPPIRPIHHNGHADKNSQHHCQELYNVAASVVVDVVVSAALIYATPLYYKIPYHTSVLSDEGWVQELIHGHPERIRMELGMHCPVFLQFVRIIHLCGLYDSRHVFLEEQAAIFLYTCVTGFSIHHIGKRFQHSSNTISR